MTGTRKAKTKQNKIAKTGQRKKTKKKGQRQKRRHKATKARSRGGTQRTEDHKKGIRQQQRLQRSNTNKTRDTPNTARSTTTTSLTTIGRMPGPRAPPHCSLLSGPLRGHRCRVGGCVRTAGGASWSRPAVCGLRTRRATEARTRVLAERRSERRRNGAGTAARQWSLGSLGKAQTRDAHKPTISAPQHTDCALPPGLP